MIAPNPLKQSILARGALRRGLSDFFVQHRYIEIDTPVLVRRPGTEVHLGYFSSQWRDIQGREKKFWLRSSPELHMKIALGAGLERIYQFASCFRNDGELGPIHRPEFTMLEYYETAIDFESFIARTEDLIRAGLVELAAAIPSANHFQMPATVPRFSVYEAFKEFAGVTLVDEDPDLAKLCI